MNSDDDIFEVGSAGEMRRKYRLYAGNQPVIELRPDKVPEKLWPLIPCAEIWGITDDLIREDFVNKATAKARSELKKVVAEYAKELDDWLAGPEALAKNPSKEYIAFTAMRMAVDFMPSE